MTYRDYAACFVMVAAVGLMYAVIVECALAMAWSLAMVVIFSCLAR